MSIPGIAARTAATLRRARAVELRIAGYSTRRIAQELGVSYGQIHRDIKRALAEEAPTEEAAVIRQEQTARYLRVLTHLWPMVMAKPPDLDAIDRWRAIMQRLDRIWGLEAKEPTIVDLRTQVLSVTAGGDPREALYGILASLFERVGPPEGLEGGPQPET